MNNGELKKFAASSRKELIEKIKIKALQYGIEEDKISNSQIVSSDFIVSDGKLLSKEEKLQREKLIEKIKAINEEGGDGYKQVIEEIAYTWFNRFTALRFMEINKYLPTRVRALSSETPGNVEPDLIKEACNVDLKVDKKKICQMKLNNDIEGLFKYLIIAQCHALNKFLPFIFEKTGYYTELLFPDGLLDKNAFIRRLTNTEVIPESHWEDVEIIGWLYQYYISQENERIIKAKKKYKKAEIPFATQLFTPDWIVRYMVQNTLGRYWIESHPEHGDLKKNWELYLDTPDPDPNLGEKLAPYINRELKAEDIKCFDPAMGSGHILVYTFDVLYQIYEKCGYMIGEIPKLIIENNLYGLDIDDTAYGLACFAVIMRGMKYNKELLINMEKEAKRGNGEGIKLNLASIQETNNLNNDDIAYIAGENSGNNYNKTRKFVQQFKNAKIYGSLIKIEDFDQEFFYKRLEYITNNPAENLVQEGNRKKIIEVLSQLIKQTEIMIKLYDVLITNPPYIGAKYLNSLLSKFLTKYYKNNKGDTFSAFIEYAFDKVKSNGHLGFMSPFVWMFISSYEALRKMIIDNKNISSLIQLEYSAFKEATVPICTFTLRNYNIDISGEYIRLSNFKGEKNQLIKTKDAINNPKVKYRFTINQKKMKNIPGIRFGYWLTKNEMDILNRAETMLDKSFPCTGMQTGNNDKYIRQWFEVKYENINFNKEKEDKKYWIPYQMGGEARKWYGNISEIIYWKNNGEEVRKEKGSVIRNEGFYFKKGISWKRITSSINTIRVLNEGFIFDQSADSIFVKEKSDYNYILSFFNSKIMINIFEFIAPTLNLTAGTVKEIPIYIENNLNIKRKINLLCEECIDLSKYEWDSFETSWNFKNNPILLFKNEDSTLEEALNNWIAFTEKQFYKLKENEEELNKIFIDIYDLQNEMTAEVNEKDITIRKAYREREIKSFISYAVGCIFGRYSLDKEGLVYTGGEFDFSKYTKFKVDEDNIIPVLDDSYFKDDIVDKFVEFVKLTFGEEKLLDNLDFIAETLGRKNNETIKETIRRYFLNDFFKNHLQVYKNRPIYWMLTSGKEKAFNCLIYIHRYDKTTLSRVRTNYLHKLQDRLVTERKAVIDIISGDYGTEKKNYAKKKLTAFDKQIDELNKYDEVLHHRADMQIEIDLDNGIKVNYQKFKGLLAKI